MKYLTGRISILIILFAAFWMGACNTTRDVAKQSKESAPEGRYTPQESALLWKIEGKGVKKPSYLYGTIHIIDGESFFWPNGTLAAVEATDRMVFEIDMNDMTDIASQMALMPRMLMQGNQSLEDLLSEEDYNLVAEHFADKGMPMFMINRMKPMVASAMAELDMDQLGAGFDGPDMKSYEFEFFELAQNRNMDIGGLETMDYQISLFDSIPYGDQARMLVESINSTQTDDALEQMIDLYVTQDIEGMYEMMGSEDEYFQRILLFNRNENWIPVIEEEVKAGSVFFAVGAGHLGGEKGVVQLLKDAGYTLTPMSL